MKLGKGLVLKYLTWRNAEPATPAIKSVEDLPDMGTLKILAPAQEGTIAAALDNQSMRATPGAEDRTDVEGIDSPPE